MKTGYLFLLITILFGCSFYVVNLKFDKFYRVNGINNDNRVLIEKYLDKSEQTYLIDNQISIDLFIDYIDKDDFHLQNYQYYNYLKDSKHYKKTSDILNIGNSLATRLEYLYKDDAFDYAQILIDSSLESDFLNEEKFNFEYINIYNDLKTLYDHNDSSYVLDADQYIQSLKLLGITDFQEIEETIHMLTLAYSKETLSQLLTTELALGTTIVYNPYQLSTLVNETHFIGEYEPNDLLLTQDIPRVSYAMYLQSDAYHALVKMYQDLSNEYDGFILRKAYVSAQELEEDQRGYNECQLGLTINVSKTQTPYETFAQTDISQWLEKHAHEYGFILRYPKGKASITNHSYDAHIYRYVGNSLSLFLYNSQMTLEEYHAQENHD